MIQICIKSFWRNIFTPIIQLHRKEKKLKKEILRKEQVQLYSLLYTRIRLRRKWLRMVENKRWANAIKQHTQNNFQMNTQKRCPLHYRGLECKSRKSRNTWSNRQIWPWNTEWRGQRLIAFCQENALVITNTLFQQHQRRLYTWTSPDGQHQNQIDFAAKDGEALYSQQKQDQELTVAQIMNSLLPNSDLNWRMLGKPLDHSGMT